MSNWTFEPGHTQARFRARHMMVTYVDGLIKDVHGRVHWDPERPEATRFEATLDLATLWTGVEARDNHLKSGDFFDVENHPKITFESKAVKTLSATELRVEGNLTMRGVTKPVVLEASYVGSWNTPYWESKAGEWKDFGPVRRVGFTGHLTINRHDWGISWQDYVDKGGVVVSDEIDIQLDAEALFDEDVARAERALRDWKPGAQQR